MPRVLITGAAGFIGMHTSIRFLKGGWYVVGIDNMNNYYSNKLKYDRIKNILKSCTEERGHFEFYEIDINNINDTESLKNNKFDAIIHLAAQAGVRYSLENPRAYLESNVLGFQSILEYVLKEKISIFLYASSSSVYGKTSNQPMNEFQNTSSPESYYAATKKANELMAYAYSKTHNTSSIGLRFFTVYGPWGRPDMAPSIFLDAIVSGKPIRVFNYGKQKRDFTYVDDISESIYRLSQIKSISGAHVYNIGNGSPLELKRFIDLIEQHSGKKAVKLLEEAKRGDVEETYADITALSKIIDFSPDTDINIGIKKFIDWYLNYHNKLI